MQRQVGEDQPVAVGEVLDDRLELAVAEQRGVQQHEARPAARLAVGDARAVGVVVEAQLHPVASPARCPRASAAATRAPASVEHGGRALDVALQLGVDARRAPRAAARGADEVAQAQRGARVAGPGRRGRDGRRRA